MDNKNLEPIVQNLGKRRNTFAKLCKSSENKWKTYEALEQTLKHVGKQKKSFGQVRKHSGKGWKQLRNQTQEKPSKSLRKLGQSWKKKA